MREGIIAFQVRNWLCGFSKFDEKGQDKESMQEKNFYGLRGFEKSSLNFSLLIKWVGSDMTFTASAGLGPVFL